MPSNDPSSEPAEGSDEDSTEQPLQASESTEQPATDGSTDAGSTTEHLSEDPVIGDGVVTFPSTEENLEMPQADLPEAVAGQLMTESVGNIQANNRDGRNIGTLAAGVLQGAMARNFDELGTIESRANSGVIATPIASPTTQAARA